MKNLLRRDAYFYLKITHCTFPDCIPFSDDLNIDVDLYYILLFTMYNGILDQE